MVKQFYVYILASNRNGTLYIGITSITREKQLKRWNRKWKLCLIEKDNPDWNDPLLQGDKAYMNLYRNNSGSRLNNIVKGREDIIKATQVKKEKPLNYKYVHLICKYFYYSKDFEKKWRFLFYLMWKITPYTQPFKHCTEPNDTWSADFKGIFDGQWNPVSSINHS